MSGIFGNKQYLPHLHLWSGNPFFPANHIHSTQSTISPAAFSTSLRVSKNRVALSVRSVKIWVLPLGRQRNSHDQACFGQVIQPFGSGTDSIENAIIDVQQAGGLHCGTYCDSEIQRLENTGRPFKVLADLFLHFIKDITRFITAGPAAGYISFRPPYPD